MRWAELILLAVSGLAQQEKPADVQGSVVNSATGEPVARALVTMTVIPAVATSALRAAFFTRSAMTDASGSFRFEGVPEGMYTCAARKPQFTLKASLNQCARIEMAPLGVITGRVTDENGLSLRAVNVYALSVHVSDGVRQIKTDRTAVTDDQGMYRIWDLAPGQYRIEAAGQAPGAAAEAYAPVYFGGIALRPGGEAVADLTVKVERGYAVRGTLAGMAPHDGTAFFETVRGDDVTPARVSIQAETGQFTVTGLPEGSFTLRATQGETTAELPISIQGEDRDGVSMRLEPPVSVPVSVRITNPGTVAVGGDGDEGRGACTAQLHAAIESGVLRAEAGGDAMTFRVRPGRYRVFSRCFGAYPVSITWGTLDLIANDEVTVQGSVAPSIEIVAVAGGGKVSGSVERADSAQPWVVFVPQGRGMPVAVPVEAHRFEAELAPGAWVAYVFSGEEEAPYREPDFGRMLTGGTAFEVDEGMEAKITITGVVR